MAKLPNVADLLPRWTKRVITEATGRDPLGLSRVSDTLTAMLVPGITTQTGRARYFALYAWILWHIEHEEAPETSEAFVEAFQRREAAIALATLMHDPAASPVGKRAVERRLEAANGAGEVSAAFRVLPSDQLGGFGQYYGGSLYALGLTHRPEGAVGDLVPSGAARLAEAVQATIGATPYVTGRHFGDAIVPFDVLERSGARLSIDAIRETFTIGAVVQHVEARGGFRSRGHDAGCHQAEHLHAQLRARGNRGIAGHGGITRCCRRLVVAHACAPASMITQS